MNPDRVRERGLDVAGFGGAVLEGVRLVFDKVSRHHPQEAHANIEYAPGCRVEGLLYELHSAVEILKMDRFEFAPINYGRDVVMVSTVSSGSSVRVPPQIPAWTYFANSAVRRPGLRPSRAYLEHLLAGVDHLSGEYFRELSSAVCRDG